MYVVSHEVGYDYEGSETETIGVFDTLKSAKVKLELLLNKILPDNFRTTTGSPDVIVYERISNIGYKRYGDYEYFYIEQFELNKLNEVN